MPSPVWTAAYCLGNPWRTGSLDPAPRIMLSAPSGYRQNIISKPTVPVVRMTRSNLPHLLQLNRSGADAAAGNADSPACFRARATRYREADSLSVRILVYVFAAASRRQTARRGRSSKHRIFGTVHRSSPLSSRQLEIVNESSSFPGAITQPGPLEARPASGVDTSRTHQIIP